MLRFRNTLTRELEVFEPLEEGRVRIYACGPTVWNFAHIGNFRTFIFYDVLRRYLRFRGYDVTLVLNVTDVDDRIIEKTIEQGKSISELTTPFLDAFLEDMATINMERPEVMPRATEHIDEMVTLVEALQRKGYAYEADHSIYFRVEAFESYGKLSGRKLAGNEAGRGGRVEASEYAKADERDFVLWKAPKLEGETSWDTRIGVGRPGWHLECSAMSMKYLGETFDMHLGGEDLIFPHHENEIAQSEAASGKVFARYWLHAKFLNIENEKMAKSLGNTFTLRDMVDRGFPPTAIRYLLLSVPYRTQLNFTFDGLTAAGAALERLRNFERRLREAAVSGGAPSAAAEAASRALASFGEAMDEDLNTSVALAALFDLVSEVNPLIDARALSGADRDAVLDALGRIDSVLGVLAAEDQELVPADVAALVEQRAEARRTRDFRRADELRDQITGHGYVLEDTPEGTKARRR
jgi:cysteinyl-tRNA synthetase